MGEGEVWLPQCISPPLPETGKLGANTICYCTVHTYTSLCGKATLRKPTTFHLFGLVMLEIPLVNKDTGLVDNLCRIWEDHTVIFITKKAVLETGLTVPKFVGSILEIQVFAMRPDVQCRLQICFDQTFSHSLSHYQLSSCCQRYCGRWKNNWMR